MAPAKPALEVSEGAWAAPSEAFPLLRTRMARAKLALEQAAKPTRENVTAGGGS
jgi:hypothetical protein